MELKNNEGKFESNMGPCKKTPCIGPCFVSCICSFLENDESLECTVLCSILKQCYNS